VANIAAAAERRAQEADNLAPPPAVEPPPALPVEDWTCPACGNYPAMAVVYGMPSLSLKRLAQDGRVHLAGCCIPGPEQPIYFKRCGVCAQMFDGRP
jgi:hypothetical protein